MSERIQKALENHKKGMNCCQAVACAFADVMDVDENTIFKLGEGFGAGMGGMQCTCGAVSGAVLVAGMKNSSGDVTNPTTKGKTYTYAKKIVQDFKEKNGTVICKELKGVETKKMIRTCDGCIEDAARIAEEVLGL
ncbi:MAG: C-GCAxxG-C-C family protein [Lachnospiraceae bacterium]|jgi:C_GCAxxG_C_C family probable redox protein|nr:C-GCAxxG-C-C family protein [Lachnospiraceae bacterium]